MKTIRLISTILIFLVITGINQKNYSQANAGPDQEICTDFTTLGAIDPSPETGNWTVIFGAATFDDISLYNTVARNIPPGITILRWTVGASSDEVVITNNSVTADAGPDQEICTDHTTLAANDPSLQGAAGHWTVNAGGGTITNHTLYNSEVTNLSPGINMLGWTVEIESVCFDFDDVMITSNSVTADAGPDQVICTDHTTLAANDPSLQGATGIWTILSGAGVFTNPTLYNSEVTNLSPGIIVLGWNVATESICFDSDNLTITNNSVTADAGPDQEICTDHTTLAANDPSLQGAAGYWTVNAGGGTITNHTLYNSEVTNLSPGIIVLGWNVATESICFDSDNLTITNNSVTADAGPDQEICTDYTTLAANDPSFQGATGLWTILGGAAIIVNSTLYNSEVTGLSAGVNALRWTITDGECVDSDFVTITNNLPDVAVIILPILENREVCANTVYLEANNPIHGTGYWTVYSGSGIFSNPTYYQTNVTGMNPGNNTFGWTISNGICQSVAQVTIINNEVVSHAGSDQIICIGYTNLSAVDPAFVYPFQGEGYWTLITGAGDIINPSLSTTSVTNLSPGDNVFRWTVTNGECSSFDEVTVTYIFANANAGPDQEICTDHTTLTANDPSLLGATGYWTMIAGAGTITNPTLYNSEVTGLSAGVNTLRWTVVIEGICSDDDIVTVTYNSLFVNAGPDQEICTDYTTLAANDPSYQGATGLWTMLSGGGTIVNPTLCNSEFIDLYMGVNVLRWTITDGECIDSDNVTIVNNSVSDTNAGPDQVTCADYAYLSALHPGAGETGVWTVIGGTGNIENPTNYTTQVTELSFGENILRWTISNGECSASDDINVFCTLPDSTDQVYAGPDQQICADNTTLEANSLMPGWEGLWTIMGGMGNIVDPTNTITEVNNLSYGINALRWTIYWPEYGCYYSDEVLITNNSVIAFAGQDQTLAQYDTDTYFEAELPPNSTGQWSVLAGSGNIANLNSPTSYVDNMPTGENIFTWTVNNTLTGCSASDDVSIFVDDFTIECGDDQVICQSTAVMNAEFEPGAVSHEWSIVSGGGVFDDIHDPETVVRNIPLGGNVYKWTAELDEFEISCTVTVINDSIYAGAGDDATLCEDYHTMNAEHPEGTNSMWTLIGLGGGTIVNNTSWNTLITNLQFGTNLFEWHTTRIESGCESRDTVAITSYANAADAGTDDTISVSLYELQAVSFPGLNGIWSVEYGTGTFEDNSFANTIVSNLTYGDNIFRWNTSYNGCNDFDDVMLTLTVYAGEDFEVEGDTVYLDAVLPEGAIGEWTIMYGAGTFEDDTDPKTRVWDLSPGPNTLRWTVTFPKRGNRELVLWDEVTATKTVSTNDLLSKSLIYPNPSNGIINIISGKSLEKADIKIYNISGSLVKFKILNKSANELKINLSQNTPGMYFIKIKTQNSIIIEKLIIEQTK